MTAQRRQPEKPRRGSPARTPEHREQQLVGLAVEVAERQMREGTASAQVITHYLKLGSTRGKLEEDRLRRENELLSAKVEQMASNSRIEELYEEAIRSMRTYAGQDDDDGFDHDER